MQRTIRAIAAFTIILTSNNHAYGEFDPKEWGMMPEYWIELYIKEVNAGTIDISKGINKETEIKEFSAKKQEYYTETVHGREGHYRKWRDRKINERIVRKNIYCNGTPPKWATEEQIARATAITFGRIPQ